MFRFSLSFSSILILPDNYNADQISYLSIGAFTVGKDGSQLNMLVHIKATASDSVNVTISLRSRIMRGVVVPPSTSFHPATVALIWQVDSPLTGTFSTHCHSDFSRSGETLRYMAHCTVTTSVLHKTLYCPRYTDPCSPSFRLQSKRGDPLGRPTLTKKPTHAHTARSN